MRVASLCCLAVVCLCCSVTLSAQQYTDISGLVFDPSGAVVPEASISVVSQDTGFRRHTLSGQNGWYAVASLQPGLYKITVRRTGFRTLIRFGIKLDAGQGVRLDFTLPLGTVPEAVTVSGAPPLLNSDDASVGTIVSRDRIENLPLNGRGLLSLLEFAPGTVVTPATRGEPGQFSSSGQRPSANYFIVDGVSANTGVSGGGLPARTTGGSLPSMTALGSLHGIVSLEALEEFRVQTSTAAAEFGSLPGAQVLLSSRSGSNEFHGSVFEYLRRGSLDANNWFSNRNAVSDSELALDNYGASLGGPIKRNQAFFFASYEGMRLKEPFAWHSAAPTEVARSAAPDWVQPALELFPLPNGETLDSNLAEWRGQYDRRSSLNTGSLRLDYAVTPRLTAFGRFAATQSSNEFTSTQVNELSIRSQTATLGTSYRLGSHAIFDFKMNRSAAAGQSWWRPQTLAATACSLDSIVQYLFPTQTFSCDYLLRLSIGGVGDVINGTEGDQRQRQWQLLPSVVLSLGSHQIRAGFNYRHYVPERFDRAESLSVIAEAFIDLASSSRLWTAQSPAYHIASRLSEMSTYIEDTWRIHPLLTANFGLRWEANQEPTTTSTSDASVDLVAADYPPVWRDAAKNLAPRVGLAFRTSREGRTVIRGGWGRYFDSTLSVATDIVNGGPFSLSQYGSAKNGFVKTFMRYGFAPDLRLPTVDQWNVSIERRIGERDVISVGYLGAAGRHLLRREIGIDGSFRDVLALATNNGRSDYNGLQVQYRRPMSHGVEVLASYSWSHSIDNSSSDSLLHWVSPDITAAGDLGSSDFDVRQVLNVAVTYESQAQFGNGFTGRLLRGWAIDGILRARTGFPVGVLDSEYSSGLSLANAYRPNIVANQPIWIEDPSVPNGQRLNRDAFSAAGSALQGNLGRNAIRGFGMHQIDLALRRKFQLGDKQQLHLRLEAFNLFNHPNFADPARFLSSTLFGTSPSTLNLMLGTGSPGSGLTPVLQTGGARSLQIVLRYRF